MESDAGTADGARRLRPLNEPRLLAVRPDVDGAPLAIRTEAVKSIEESWRVDDGWWREEHVSRRYWQVTLASGRTITVFQNLLTGQWYAQRY